MADFREKLRVLPPHTHHHRAQFRDSGPETGSLRETVCSMSPILVFIVRNMGIGELL